MFGSTDEAGVSFTHSALAWSVLYNRLIEGDFTKNGIQATVDGINEIVAGDFVYRRWDGKHYRHYPPKAPATDA